MIVFKKKKKEEVAASVIGQRGVLCFSAFGEVCILHVQLLLKFIVKFVWTRDIPCKCCLRKCRFPSLPSPSRVVPEFATALHLGKPWNFSPSGVMTGNLYGMMMCILEELMKYKSSSSFPTGLGTTFD